MAGDFIGLIQGQININTSTSTPLTIPKQSEIIGYPVGQPMVMRICAKTDAVYKLGSSVESASKIITSGFYPQGNIYAEKGAIETFKVVSPGGSNAPTTIHAIADTFDGVFRCAFGYYL